MWMLLLRENGKEGVYEGSGVRASPVSWYFTYQVMWRAAPRPALMGEMISLMR